MDRPEYIIREANARDFDAMVGLLRQLFSVEDDFTFDRMKQLHGCAALMADHGRSVIRLAELRNTVVGMCTAQISISTAEGGMSALIADLVVDASCRSRGIGSALLASVGTWAIEHGCLRMQLLADKRNGRAIEFYRRAGWNSTNMVCLNKRIFIEPSFFSPPFTAAGSLR